MKNPIVKTLVLVVMLIAFGAGIGLYSSSYYQQQIDPEPVVPGLLWPNPKQLQVFTSIDHNGNEFGLSNLTGHWSFIFFGFTHCPDICPISLGVLNTAYKALNTEYLKENIQVIFTTVDPERDTTEHLKQYIEYYNEEFIGLGGSKQQVDSLARQIGIAYGKSDIQSETEYQVDHSASIFLIDPQGRLVGVFSAPHEPQQLLNRFHQIKSFIQTKS